MAQAAAHPDDVPGVASTRFDVPVYGAPGHWAAHLDYCKERIEPRFVGGKRKRIVVGLIFTVMGQDHESQPERVYLFRQRMEAFAEKLEALHGCEVLRVDVQRRKAAKPVAEFEVLLPDYRLPRPDAVA